MVFYFGAGGGIRGGVSPFAYKPMVKDEKYLKKFRYLAAEHYRFAWEFGVYRCSRTHQKRIKNFWDTYKHYGFNKDLLN